MKKFYLLTILMCCFTLTISAAGTAQKNIVFVGAGRQIRIWAEELWNEREQNRDYAKIREIMLQYDL